MVDELEIQEKFKLSQLQPLPFDASTRRYFRALEGVVMVDQDEGFEERIGRFLDIAKRLERAGLRPPIIYAAEPSEGYVFMEDLGSIALKNAPSDENFQIGFRNLSKLRTADADGLKIYSKEIYQEELSRLMRYYLQPLGIDDQELLGITDAELEELGSKSNHFVHLDYHAENILILGDGSQALIDFQDARQGHRLYDLVSFVDAERAPISAKLKEKFTEGMSLEDRHDFNMISAQRLLKIIGIFARLTGEGREKYARLLPQIFALLDDRFATSELKLWQEWFLDVVPRPSQNVIEKLQAEGVKNGNN